MKMYNTSLLAIFTSRDVSELRELSEYQLWFDLHSIYMGGHFKNESVENVISHYKEYENKSRFYNIQLKFFLLRASKEKQNIHINHSTSEWYEKLAKESHNFVHGLSGLSFTCW